MAVCKLRLRLFPSWPLYSSCRLMGTAGGDGEPTKFQPPPKPVIVDKTSQATQRKFLSPEFIPPRGRTDPLKYSIERKDMVARRKLLTIPEFYVGVEIRYDLYSPRIQEIQVLKLEKRLDDNLMYLRDALPEYSTFDFDMKVVPHSINEEVPVNQLKVRMKPKPWSKRWERPQFKVQGIRFDLCLKEEQLKEAKKWDKPWLEFDMLKEYDTTKIEETIWKEINPQPN
ncbi:39S ribosomal protein L19, mitochondrial isoform X2 [Rhinatrema bivittatum]|uniref:39S ribosomal protein L19, mitochondrial isoform X2 n=1 Tax=Rhinatrema bivittatum TaxID=194408 RepID=UPI0011271156|nr:39S ribosomal protein L19, mitochondrial isoform X2 [Rhinatrema bivittatum]